MKDAATLTVLIIVVCFAIFYGATFLFKSSIKSTPTIERDAEYEKMIRDQRRRMDETQERQKDSMRDQKQRIRDMQRN